MTVTKPTQIQPAPWLPKPAPPLIPQPGTIRQTDTVHINNFVKAAVQEATETPDQTAGEARNGDPQAQRLLAKEAAERNAMEGK